MATRLAGPAARWQRQAGERPQLLLMVAALAAGVVAGFLVGNGNAAIALFAGLAIPLAVLVLRYPLAGLMVWMVAMPFVSAVGAEGQAGPLFWMIYRLGIPAILVVGALHRASRTDRGAFRVGVIDVALLLFLVVGAVNVALLANDQGRTFISFYDKLVVPIVVFWVIRVLEPSPEELRRLVPVAIWTVLAQAIIGAMSWVAPRFLPDQWLGREGERTVGTLGGPGPYTIGIVFFSLLLVYWAMQTTSTTRRRILFGIVAAGLGAVLLSLSRGSWLGAAAAFGGLILVYPRQVRWAAVVGAVVAVLLFLGPLSSTVDRLSERFGTVDTVDARLITNDAAVRMVADRPLLGFGWGNFDQFDESYKQPVGDVPLRLGGTAHNTYLNLAVEFGLAGAILYLAPVLILLVMTLRRRRILKRQPWRWQLVVVLWLALADQFLVNNFAEMIHSSEWATSIWWITLGLIAVALLQWRDDVVPIPPSGALSHRRR
jgi:O-antigen ligase